MIRSRNTIDKPGLTRRAGLLGVLGLGAGCSGLGQEASSQTAAPNDAERKVGPHGPPFSNLYRMPGDIGVRASAGFIARRAYVQLTRDLKTTEVPPTTNLDFASMARRSFAASWLGHSTFLLRIGRHWVLTDPILHGTAGPVAGLGPARLTPLPFKRADLPRIDVVLVSHDHYDHLDLPTMRDLARQSGGPPRVCVGLGLASWFRDNVGVEAQEFGWWDRASVLGVDVQFTPAQHNSGRSLTGRNTTLWGGWMLRGAGRAFYFSGDTAYVPDLFSLISQRTGSIALAAVPIGSYKPQDWMRFEHLNPEEAINAHHHLGAQRSIGMHWGTFQLGDDEPIEPLSDLAVAVERQRVSAFGVSQIGAILDVVPPNIVDGWMPPRSLRPVMAAPGR